MHERKKALWLFILLCFQVSVAFAEINYQGPADSENCQTKEVIRLRGIALRIENDSFAKTDRDYSNGLTLTAESYNIKDYPHTECLPWILRLHSKLIKLLTPDFWTPPENRAQSHSVAAKLGQSIFTPGNSASPDLILNDRPYAGVLYVGLSLHQRHNIPQTNLEVLDTREINLGIIGPLSFAKEFQDAAHNLLGDERFRGWNHQLNNELALQVAMEKKFKGYSGREPTIPGFSVDFIRSVGVRLGNIETSANVGIEGRLGWNLPNDFGSFTIRPGTESHPPEALSANTTFTEGIANNVSTTLFGIHLFTILELNFVAYDFSLDGNLFSKSHHVTRQPWVTFGAIGLNFPTLLNKRRYNLAIMDVYQSSEFKEQKSHHAYRSVGLSVEF